MTRSILPDPSRADLPIRGRAPQSVQNMYLPGVCRGTQEYAGVYRSMQGYTGVCRGIQEYAGVCMGIQRYAEVYRGIQRYTGVQRYTHQVRMNRNTCIHAIKSNRGTHPCSADGHLHPWGIPTSPSHLPSPSPLTLTQQWDGRLGPWAGPDQWRPGCTCGCRPGWTPRCA